MKVARRAMMIGLATYPLPSLAQPIEDRVTHYGITPPPQKPVGWRVTFFDDFAAFNQGRGTDLYGNSTGIATTGAQYPIGSGHLAKWNTGFLGTTHLNGTKELQCYCNPTRNGIDPFSRSDSILSITARVPNEAEVNSLFGQSLISGALSSELFMSDAMDGYYEASIKFARGANGYSGGLWGAWWLSAPDWPPELDIVEQWGAVPTATTGHIHYGLNGLQIAGTGVYPVGVDITQDLHTYGGLITPNYIAWYFDGALIGSTQRGRGADTHSFNNTTGNSLRLLLNFALGPGEDGVTPTAAQLPAVMQIDWVKVSALGPQ